MLWALGGFNLGIEAAQVGVAALAALANLLWSRRSASGPTGSAQRWLRLAALAVGVVWLVLRLLPGARL